MCNVCTRDIDPSEAPQQEPMTPLESIKKKHSISVNPHDEEKQKEVAYQPDLLAVSTQSTKVVYNFVRDVWGSFKKSNSYTVLTKTTQPFHITLAAIVLLAWISRAGSSGNSRVWTAIYVAGVAVHLGTQIWMTLISGVVLYFSLPRHEFGRVQTILFPIYYMFNSIVSFLALFAYFKVQCINGFERSSFVQLALLLSVFSIEAYVRLRLVHPMLIAKHLKTNMEMAAGGGQEVGRLVLGELAHCPHYMKILKTFRAYHSSIATGTMITLGCSLYSTMIIVDSVCH